MQSLTETIADRLVDLGGDVAVANSADRVADLTVTFTTSAGPTEVAVDVKLRSQPLHLSEAQRWQRSRAATPSILALRSIPTGTARQYRALGINYIDSGGNTFLQLPGLHIHVEGMRPTVTESPGSGPSAAWTNPAGLKVIFGLLVRPEILAESYERIARVCTVSKGTVSNTIGDLRRRGHITGDGPRRHLIAAGHLTSDWIDGYVRDLGPRLTRLELFGPEPDWWEQEWTVDMDLTIGGGLALTHHGASLRTDHTVLYGAPPWPAARQAGRLVRERTQGRYPVTLKERFWSAELLDDSMHVPMILAIADAFAGGDPREAEVARQLAAGMPDR